MDRKRTLSRRKFLTTAAAASSLTVLPRHVLGGAGRVAPSDKITMALIGAGPQGLGMLMNSWLPNEDIQVTAVVDPNTDSDDYRSWSRHGKLYQIRNFLDEPDWGSEEDGIRCGREVGRYIVDTYYKKKRGDESYRGCATYADFRELLAQEQDLDGVFVITPEHLHGTIALAGMRAGKHVVMHKTLANVFEEARMVGNYARESDVVTHFLAWHNDPQIYQIRDWLRAGAIGQVKEVHNWSRRPVWPQGWFDWLEEQPIPQGLDWNLWLGPVPHMPYNLNYTHALFRGWYEFGSGCLGDMGQYSLWRVYRMLGGMPDPVVFEGFPATDARVIDGVSRPYRGDVSFPKSGTIRMMYPAHGDNGPIDIFWYDGGIKPITPDELFPMGEELSEEGMLFVGTEGKILGGFGGENPRILPEARARRFADALTTDTSNLKQQPQEWIDAVKNGTGCRAAFENVQGLAEATCLANLSLRLNKRLVWDSKKAQITSDPDADKYLKRTYRDGWEL